MARRKQKRREEKRPHDSTSERKEKEEEEEEAKTNTREEEEEKNGSSRNNKCSILPCPQEGEMANLATTYNNATYLSFLLREIGQSGTDAAVASFVSS